MEEWGEPTQVEEQDGYAKKWLNNNYTLQDFKPFQAY